MKVKIKCPKCNKIQFAEVIESIPFYSYTHECEKCGYLITEREWEEIKKSN